MKPWLVTSRDGIQLLTDFFKLLGLDDKVIYHDVEGMEHHISAPTLRAIELLTQRLPAATSVAGASGGVDLI